jgi:hypothetical protein
MRRFILFMIVLHICTSDSAQNTSVKLEKSDNGYFINKGSH